MLTYFSNPARFRALARWLVPLSAISAALLLIPGLYYALFDSPPDYQQKESVRIMYIHVPAAWVSLMAYASMGAAAIAHLVWKHVLGGLYIRAVAPVGATFTAICLVSGSLWGLPTWGTWWVWDARLTSVLILFFLYAGIILLDRAYDDQDRGLTASSWLAAIGLINLPIIKYSVTWWNTLHQPASLTSFSKIANPAIAPEMLHPLLLMAGAFTAIFTALALIRLRTAIAERKERIHER
ncbi:MAG TPA: heme ABC transporter permease CcmC [Micavibrio sp.]|jgi:heme exporter protein C